MKENLIKLLIFIVGCFAAKQCGNGAYFVAQGILIIVLWGTWLRQDKSQPVKKWNDILNYIGLMSIVTGVSQLLK